MSRMSASTDNGLSLANEQYQAMRETTAAFTVIEQKVERIVGQLLQLNEELHHSQEKSGRVLQSIENISAVTEQSAAGSQEIAASTAEQRTAFAASYDKLKHLIQIAKELHLEIERFKLDEKQAV